MKTKINVSQVILHIKNFWQCVKKKAHTAKDIFFDMWLYARKKAHIAKDIFFDMWLYARKKAHIAKDIFFDMWLYAKKKVHTPKQIGLLIWLFTKWLTVFASFATVFVLLHILFVGKESNLQKADVAVVFGAKVYHNGRLSDALYDRTKTACDLYHQGFVKQLLFSGGWDVQMPYSEPQAMRQFALRYNIPDSAIILDENGINTQATIQNTAQLAQQHHWKTILMISHDYHLARIQLICEHQNLDVFTVPAQESFVLTAKPYFILREVAAWMYYWAIL